MNKIHITEQTAIGQYDSEGRQVTHWDNKRCSWIVNKEFEDCDIDWYGKDSDFPGGCTAAEYEAQNPDWEKRPNVSAVWYYDSIESLIASFGERYYWEKKYNQSSGKLKTPEVVTRDWSWMDIPKEDTVNFFGTHADFHKGADRVIIKYNDEVLYDGPGNKLKRA